jgi:hypothetical protein
MAGFEVSTEDEYVSLLTIGNIRSLPRLTERPFSGPAP